MATNKRFAESRGAGDHLVAELKEKRQGPSQRGRDVVTQPGVIGVLYGVVELTEGGAVGGKIHIAVGVGQALHLALRAIRQGLGRRG